MLAILHSISEGPDLHLDKPVLLLGRHEECDVQLSSAKVSRRHCIIASVNSRLVIRDLGSTNGVRVNGQRHDEAELHDGDELTIGNFRYRVNIAMDPTSLSPLSLARGAVSSEVPVALPDDENDAAPVAKKAIE
jgi:pSer/pThr/pTyr-binding forkhead associated (FHA) protein